MKLTSVLKEMPLIKFKSVKKWFALFFFSFLFSFTFLVSSVLVVPAYKMTTFHHSLVFGSLF